MASNYQALSSDGVESPARHRGPLVVGAVVTLVFLAVVATTDRVPSSNVTTFVGIESMPSSNVTTFVGTEPTKCRSDTGGSCWILPCRKARGPTECTSKHKCRCQEGYCAGPDGVCHKSEVLPTPAPAKSLKCSNDTGTSCLLIPCLKKQGPTECKRTGRLSAKCVCQAGYCAGPDGVCHKHADLPSFLKSVTNDIACWKETGGSCQVLDCYKERGPTQCYIGGCYCAPGYCAREDGKCYPKGNGSILVHSGFKIRNVQWPDQQLYVKGCGANTFDEPAIDSNLNDIIMLANSKEDKGDQGKFALWELTSNGNPAYLLQSLAFPKCLVTLGEPWQNHDSQGSRNRYANIYKTVMGEPIKDLRGTLDGLAWQIRTQHHNAERPKQVQIGTTSGWMMYLRTTSISDEPTFDVSKADLARGPGSFWTTDPPLPHLER